MNPLIAHIHLLKCGGTSFSQLLERHFGPRHLNLYDDDSYFVYTVEALEERLRQTPDVAAFSSHHVRIFPPQLNSRPVLHVTFLRDPVQQFVSYMTHAKKHYAEYWHPSVLEALPPHTPEMSLREIARWILSQNRDIAFRENYNVNFFTRHSAPGCADRVATAQQALHNFFFVGITERLDESVRKLRRISELHGISFPERAVGMVNISSDFRDGLEWINPDDEVGAMLLDSVREDRKLYQWAVACLDEDLWNKRAEGLASGPQAVLAAPGAASLYLDFVKHALTGIILPKPYRVTRAADVEALPAELQSWLRSRHLEVVPQTAPDHSESAIALRRLSHLQQCAETLLREQTPGDFLEAGVWRGGSSIFLRAILKAYGVNDRTVWLADDWHPASDSAVPLEAVKQNFLKYGLLDQRVAFLAGNFADTLPKASIERLALLRIAGDRYEPTTIALRSLYPKLAKGAYFLIDHYGVLESCREAIDDFRAEFGITEPVQQIDWACAGWRVERPIVAIADVLSTAKGLMESEPARLSMLEDDPALHTLLQQYADRPDLQEAYPEAAHWDFRRLTEWARHAASGIFGDSSSAALSPHREWFDANTVSPPRDPFEPVSPPWTLLRETSARSANPLPHTLRRMRSSQSSDIHAQLMALALLVTEFRLQQIVELGVGQGNSTIALLEAAHAIGGRVFSIDIEPSCSARRLVEAAGLARHWTFVQANALRLGQAQIPRPIDLLFVDTFHLYTETFAELEKWIPYVRPGGWIALHETVSSHGVSKAVSEVLAKLPRKPRFYSFTHQNGMSLLRLAEPGTERQ